MLKRAQHALAPVLVCLLTPLPCDQVVRLAFRAEHIQRDGGELQGRPALHHQDLVVALGTGKKHVFKHMCHGEVRWDCPWSTISKGKASK